MLSESVRKKILKRLDLAIEFENDAHPDHSAPHHHQFLPDEDGNMHARKSKHSQREIEKELRMMFQAIDKDGSMMLSRAEFKEFLSELKISFSHRRWRQIFNQIDRNYDDSISFDELFLFLFPHHDEALVSYLSGF